MSRPRPNLLPLRSRSSRRRSDAVERHPAFLLKADDRLVGAGPEAAVGAAGIEAMAIEQPLNFRSRWAEDSA